MTRTRNAMKAAGAALVMLPSAALAQTESRLSADVSATAGYSNNPFSTVGDDTGGAVASIDVAPRYQVSTERSTFTVSADANFQQYLRRYGRNENYAAALDYQGRPSERWTTHARIDLASAVLGSFNSYLPTAFNGGIGAVSGAGTTTSTGGASGTASTGTGPAPVISIAPLVPINDIGLFGLRNRRSTGRVSGDVGVGVSDRDRITVSGYAEATRYKGLSIGDYEAYGGSLGYSRFVSSRLTVGLRGSASSFDYRSGNADSRVYSAEATASGRVNEFWTVNGALGVSFVDSDTTNSTRSTSLSGNIDACRRGRLSVMCLQVARQVSPTGLAGSQYVTSVGTNWSRQIGPRENLSLSGNYSKVGGNNRLLVANVLPVQSEYVQAVAGYDRQLRERLRFVASVNYRQLLGGNTSRPKDFGAQAGLSYRLGDKR